MEISAVTAQPAGAAVSCTRSGDTLAANRDVRVFERTDQDGQHFIYGCFKPKRRVRTLGSSLAFNASFGSDVEFADLRRHKAVLIGLPARSSFSLHNLRTGARRDVSTGEIQALKLTGAGSVAWIERSAETTRVLVTTHGHPRLLDDQPGIDPRSLTAGRQIRWTRNGQPQSAPLRSRR
jgi:hypothetical protein